jgi:hypothetical protein
MAALTRTATAGATAARSACAVCGEGILPGDKAVRCSACGIDYHRECWHYLGERCARLGCGGRSEPARQARAASPPLATAPPPVLLRLDKNETAAVAPQRSPVQSHDLITGAWATPQLAAVAGGGSALFLDLIFHLTQGALRWAMGEPRFAAAASLHGLAACSGASWWLWLLGGGIYGILHRRYLAGSLRNLYPPLRLLLAYGVLGSLALGLGHLPFLLTYRWPDRLWGLPAALIWMPRYFAWIMLVVACWRATNGYSLPTDLFYSAGEVSGIGLALALNAVPTGLLLGGILHGAGWLAGGCLDLLGAGHELATRIAGTLGFWGMNIGFVGTYLLALLGKQARQRRQRQGG